MNVRGLLWSSPLGQSSDIGQFSLAILRALAKRRVPVAVWATSPAPHYRLPWPGVERIDEGTFTGLASRFPDQWAPVYNIGNNIENHFAQIQAMLRIPGNVILHDATLQHLMAGATFEEVGSAEAYPSLMLAEYGDSVAGVLRRHGLLTGDLPRRGLWDLPAGSRFPLLGAVVRGSRGVIVHSRFQEHRLRESYAGPLSVLRLPWDYPRLFPTATEVAEWQDSVLRKPNLRLMAYGYIGRSKCLEELIQAVAGSASLMSQCDITIMGRVNDHDYLASLKELSTRLGMRDRVSFRLNVSLDEARDEIAKSDMFYNFRRVATEGASGSLIEQMISGRPVLVADSGSFSELPEHAVCRVPADAGIAQLTRALEGLLQDHEELIATGFAGRTYALSYDADTYVNQLLAHMESTSYADRTVHSGVERPLRAFIRDDIHAFSPQLFLTLSNEGLAMWIAHTLGWGREMRTESRHRQLLARVVERSERTQLWDVWATLRRRVEWCSAYLERGEKPPHLAREERLIFWALAQLLPPRQLVLVCYFWLYGRTPDEAGLSNWLDASAEVDAAVVMRNFVNSSEASQKLTLEFRNDLLAMIEEAASAG